jgi:hypothetical protein
MQKLLKMASSEAWVQRPGVNFTNIYEQLLPQNPYAKKITNPNCKHIKAAQKTFIQKSC